VDIAPYTAASLSETFEAIGPGTETVTAGAYEIKVMNTGLQDITVNGQTVPRGDTYRIEARSNPATQRLDLCPALTIVVPAGGAASYYVTRPSTV